MTDAPDDVVPAEPPAISDSATQIAEVAPPPVRAIVEPEIPLLEADRARIAVDDVAVFEALTLAANAPEIALVGDVAALLAAIGKVPLGCRMHVDLAAKRPPSDPFDLRGEARVVAGALRIAGLDVASGAHLGAIGYAPLDPRVPATMKLIDYVGWAARLTGARPRQAKDLAIAALDRVGLGRVAQRLCGAVSLPERRALQLAKAIVAAPAVLVADGPMHGLDSTGAAFCASALRAAASDRRLIWSASALDRTSAEGAAVLAAPHVVWIEGSGSAARSIVGSGPPGAWLGQGRAWRLTVPSPEHAAALAEALAKRQLTLSGGPHHFTVAVSDDTSAPILAAAAEARAPILDLEAL